MHFFSLRRDALHSTVSLRHLARDIELFQHRALTIAEKSSPQGQILYTATQIPVGVSLTLTCVNPIRTSSICRLATCDLVRATPTASSWMENVTGKERLLPAVFYLLVVVPRRAVGQKKFKVALSCERMVKCGLPL